MGQNAPQPVPSASQKSMALRHLEAYFASLPNAIMVWDRAGKLLFLNAAALTLFDAQPSASWLGTSAQQFLQRYEWYDEQQRPFSFPPWLLDLTTFKEETASFPYEQTLVLAHPSQHQACLELRCSLVFDGEPQPTGVLASFQVVASRYQKALHIQRVYEALMTLNEAIAQFLSNSRERPLRKPFSFPRRCSLSTNSSWTSFVRSWSAGA